MDSHIRCACDNESAVYEQHCLPEAPNVTSPYVVIRVCKLFCPKRTSNRDRSPDVTAKRNHQGQRNRLYLSTTPWRDHVHRHRSSQLGIGTNTTAPCRRAVSLCRRLQHCAACIHNKTAAWHCNVEYGGPIVTYRRTYRCETFPISAVWRL